MLETQNKHLLIYTHPRRFLQDGSFENTNTIFLRSNKVLDKQYVNIDDVYAWNLLIINFSRVTISLAA